MTKEERYQTLKDQFKADHWMSIDTYAAVFRRIDFQRGVVTSIYTAPTLYEIEMKGLEAVHRGDSILEAQDLETGTFYMPNIRVTFEPDTQRREAL